MTTQALSIFRPAAVLIAAFFFSVTAAAQSEPGSVYILAKMASATSGHANPGANDQALGDKGYAAITSQAETVYDPVLVGVGYSLSERWALEATYLLESDFHAYRANFTSGGAPVWWTSGTVTRLWRLSGFGLAAVARTKLSEDFAIFARAGAYRISHEVVTGTTLRQKAFGSVVAVTHSTESTSGRSTVPSIAFGVDAALTDHLAMRIDYEFLGRIGKDLGQQNELNGVRMWSAGVLHRF